MNRVLHRQLLVSLVIWPLVVALVLVVLPHCVSDGSGPTVLDGSTVLEEGGVADADAQFRISGTVSGLPASQTVTLTLNGGSSITTGNGPFAFDDRFANGQSYAIKATPPSGFACAVNNWTGTVNGDVTNVAVVCAAKNATLSALTISAAPLTPAFDPMTFAYTTSLRLPAVFPPFNTTTVTATPSAAGAKITVAGASVAASTPSAPVTLKGGANTIDVAVTAPDGTTTAHYTITLTGVPNDYLKPSNTRMYDYFSSGLAISADGSTLAVGADGEPSSAKGVNGSQSDSSMPNAGAVYVFTRSSAGTWTQQAFIKPSNTQADEYFGQSVALSADGNTLAVGAPGRVQQLDRHRRQRRRHLRIARRRGLRVHANRGQLGANRVREGVEYGDLRILRRAGRALRRRAHARRRRCERVEHGHGHRRRAVADLADYDYGRRLRLHVRDVVVATDLHQGDQPDREW
jgi:hypothetical protein